MDLYKLFKYCMFLHWMDCDFTYLYNLQKIVLNQNLHKKILQVNVICTLQVIYVNCIWCKLDWKWSFT